LPDAEEEMKMVKISFREAVEKVLSGEITHAPSCVLILKADKVNRSIALNARSDENKKGKRAKVKILLSPAQV
jgi:HKD family nuclease